MIEHIKNFPKHIEDSLKDLKEHNLKLEEISKIVIDKIPRIILRNL